MHFHQSVLEEWKSGGRSTNDSLEGKGTLLQLDVWQSIPERYLEWEALIDLCLSSSAAYHLVILTIRVIYDKCEVTISRYPYTVAG